VRNCSLATVESDRWAGRGIPFMKIGRLVRYRKADIRSWLESHRIVQSTTQAQLTQSKDTISKRGGGSESAKFVTTRH
jgi:hypothetical protein